MKIIFKEIWGFLECLSKARTATRLTRNGQWRLAHRLYKD